MNRDTLRYHLDLLEKGKKIFIRQESRKKYYYPFGSLRESSHTLDKISLKEKRILRIIESREGISRKDLRLGLNISSRELSVCLKSLKRKGRIWEVEKEGSKSLHLVTREMMVDEMMLDLIEMFLDGRVDIDRFDSIKRRLIEEKEKSFEMV